MTDDYEITSNEDLKTYVRTLSGYGSSDDELPKDTLDSIIGATKLELKMKGGSDMWYSDAGLGLMLLGYTLINVKSQVENIVIEEYQLGNERVRTRNASSQDNQQLNRWAQMIRTGMYASTTFSHNRPKMRMSGSYIGDTSLRDGSIRN